MIRVIPKNTPPMIRVTPKNTPPMIRVTPRATTAHVSRILSPKNGH